MNPEEFPTRNLDEPRTEPFKPLKTDEHTLLREKRATDSGLPEEPELALVAYAGEALGRVFPLREGRYILGRSAHCEIPMMDGEVSRQHAALTVSPGPQGLQVVVEDLRSTNGTRVNGREVEGTLTILPEDRIHVGGHVFKLVVLDALEKEFHHTLLEQGSKDGLTGLSNRRAIMSELGSRFQVAHRYGRPLSVILCDLDFFMKVNDTHGHGPDFPRTGSGGPDRGRGIPRAPAGNGDRRRPRGGRAPAPGAGGHAGGYRWGHPVAGHLQPGGGGAPG
jgi:pSer/pThr/pTyr-binding forkhead associated (FHA) protein